MSLSSVVLLLMVSSVSSVREGFDNETFWKSPVHGGKARIHSSSPMDDAPVFAQIGHEEKDEFDHKISIPTGAIEFPEFPDDPNKGFKISWLDMEPYRDRFNGDNIFPCTVSGSIISHFAGHEFLIFGTAGIHNDFYRIGHFNCRYHPRHIEVNPWYAEAVGLRYFSRRDNEMFIDCTDSAKKDEELKCWRWQIKPKCYRQVADEVATYFVEHRKFSNLAAFSVHGSASDRLNQDCSGAPWNGVDGSAHDWMNRTKGDNAVCWTFTWYFKALYCQYKREKKHFCAEY